MKDEDDTSNKESSNDESNEGSGDDVDNWPLVEDVIEGDKDKYPPKPTGRGHRMNTQFKQAYVPTTNKKPHPKGVNMAQTKFGGNKEWAKNPASYHRGINCA